MGTIESIDASMGAEQEYAPVSAPAVTSGVNEDGMVAYTYATEINVINAKKPSLVDYTNTETSLLIPETDEAATQGTTTSAPDYVLDDSDFDYTIPVTTTTPATSADTAAPSAEDTTVPATDAPAVTTTTTSTPPATTIPPDDEDIEDDTEEAEDDIITTEDTTQPPETTASPTETEPPAPAEEPSNNALNEMFTVNSGGRIITDTALNIVASAVMGEISDVFNEEAIKAQTIATYTYIKYYNTNNQNAYVAASTPSERILNIVKQVLGKALYYDGKMIQSVYTASTAGRTASAKNVWGIDYPYLQSKDTSFIDKDYDINFGRQATFTSEEMRNFVKNNTGIELSGDPSTWFTIESYLDEIFVGQMTIGGYSTYNDGNREVTITGRKFREIIMEYNIRSTCFKISYDAASDTFTITTYGYGHCVGLSQHGANILATNFGYTYDQILQFYYPGTTIK